ncbi:MAG: phosphatidylserine decarboxylase [Candidatus Methylomirabilales bacterium]
MVYKKLQESMPLTADRRRNKFPVASEGWSFILPLLGGALVLWMVGMKAGSLFLILFATAVGFFFRDPERFPPAEAGAILAPADGRVVRIGPSVDGRTGTEVSIFLSLFDVHINRAPCTGRIEEVLPSAGIFRVAWKEEASRRNAQTLIHFKGGRRDIFVRQVAGILARQIVTWVRPGQEVRAGERIGMIRFGSRVDLLLPEGMGVRVQIGDQVKGGESVIGVIS